MYSVRTAIEEDAGHGLDDDQVDDFILSYPDASTRHYYITLLSELELSAQDTLDIIKTAAAAHGIIDADWTVG